MTNLLRANFSRLRRDKIFWECLLTVFGCSAGFMIAWCLENAEKGALTELDNFYFRLAPAMGFFYAIFTCLFLSVEYGEGTIRNKLAVGHTRRAVYLSHFLTVFAASLCMAAAWLLGGLAGIPFLGWLTADFGKTVLYLAVIIGFTAAFSALYTCVGMLNDRRTVTVITITIWLSLMLLAGLLANTLHEPEMINVMKITMDGGAQSVIAEPNPYYISGVQREIYEFLVDFLPAGQADSLQNMAGNPVRMLLSSVFLTAAVTWGGLALFERKDLK